MHLSRALWCFYLFFHVKHLQQLCGKRLWFRTCVFDFLMLQDDMYAVFQLSLSFSLCVRVSVRARVCGRVCLQIVELEISQPILSSCLAFPLLNGSHQLYRLCRHFNTVSCVDKRIMFLSTSVFSLFFQTLLISFFRLYA